MAFLIAEFLYMSDWNIFSTTLADISIIKKAWEEYCHFYQSDNIHKNTVLTENENEICSGKVLDLVSLVSSNSA